MMNPVFKNFNEALEQWDIEKGLPFHSIQEGKVRISRYRCEIKKAYEKVEAFNRTIGQSPQISVTPNDGQVIRFSADFQDIFQAKAEQDYEGVMRSLDNYFEDLRWMPLRQKVFASTWFKIPAFFVSKKDDRFYELTYFVCNVLRNFGIGKLYSLPLFLIPLGLFAKKKVNLFFSTMRWYRYDRACQRKLSKKTDNNDITVDSVMPKSYQNYLTSLNQIEDEYCHTEEDKEVLDRIESVVKKALAKAPLSHYPKIKVFSNRNKENSGFCFSRNNNLVYFPREIFPSHKNHMRFKGIDFEVVIAHEMGHHRRRYIRAVEVLVLDSIKVALSFVVCWQLLVPAYVVLRIFQALMNHREEKLADAFAASLYGTKRTIAMLESFRWFKSLTHLFHTLLKKYEMEFHLSSFSHPSLASRIRHIESLPAAALAGV
jgi:hypothetical protein